MHQSLNDIADLAEELGNRNLVKGKVNLEKIARGKRIRFIKGNYGNYFLGQLVHYSRKFYILLNEDQLNQSESGRLRFTIAHELGHYFIDGHRTKLSNGISLSFKGDLGVSESKKMEVAANHFAANLLMPKTLFVKHALRLEPGLAAIFILKTKFDTSIESTTKHYINLNLSASVMIKWKSDYTFHYAWCSQSFLNITGLRRYSLPIRFSSDYLKDQIEIVNNSGSDYVETATPLSRWISTVISNSPKDILGLEQTVKLGDYGGITILTFQG